MSNTARWVLAIFLVLTGIFVSLFALLFLGFFTWGCTDTYYHDIAYTILYVAAALSFIAPIAPAAMLIRKTEGKFVWIAIVLGIIVTIASNGAFIFYTTNICQQERTWINIFI